MSLQTVLQQALPLTPESFDRFSNLIDPDWIDQALQSTGTASIRRRRLPAERVVWLVIGLALFRNEPIWHIVRQLGLSLNTDALPSPSVSVQGRQRLGDTPLASLFQRLARHWGVPHQPAATDWLGLRTLAVDGVVWSVPDTAENRAAFGGGRSQHGEGAWPQVRGVCLMDTESHLLLGAEFGSFAIGELSYARADGRNPRSLPDDL
ncbi:MAG: transposase domain-containing protein [Thiobacillaceae bacterium]